MRRQSTGSTGGQGARPLKGVWDVLLPTIEPDAKGPSTDDSCTTLYRTLRDQRETGHAFNVRFRVASIDKPIREGRVNIEDPWHWELTHVQPSEISNVEIRCIELTAQEVQSRRTSFLVPQLFDSAWQRMVNSTRISARM
jgi:hypothetical protein